MSITAQMVKELRERTGVGMMECKRALQEVGGDIEAAVEHMRKTGLAKADKKAGRTAAEGCLMIEEDGQSATLLEVNCETDFVAMGDDFQAFAKEACQIAQRAKPSDVQALGELNNAAGMSLEEARRTLITKIGENINIRRFVTVEAQGGTLGCYVHGRKIASIVVIQGGSAELAHDLAMHVAAFNPQALSKQDMDPAVIAKERDVQVGKFQQTGKPAQVIERMVEGAMKKYFSEVTLLGQNFLKDDKKSVEQILKEQHAEVLRFVRYELGEGIEVEKVNFADEVMAQARGQ